MESLQEQPAVLLKITEAASRLGISARAIRFYEEKGLLAPSKGAHNGYRLYSGQDLVRLQMIVSLREAGLSLEDLSNVLETYGMEEPEELSYLLELQRSLLYAKKLDLEGQIEMTEAAISRLRERGSMHVSQLFAQTEDLRTEQELIAEGNKHQGAPTEESRRAGELSAQAEELRSAPVLSAQTEELWRAPELFAQAEELRRARELRNGWADHYRFDKLAEGFDRMVGGGHEDYPGYREALSMLVDIMDPEQGEAGLDLGTGTGNLAGVFLAKGAAMKAMDQSREMLRVCRRKHPVMETRLGNMLAVPFSDQCFDFAVSAYAFHRLAPEERLLALREAVRVLKPRGRLGIVCPLSSEEWLPLQHGLKQAGFMAVLYPVPGVARVFAMVCVPVREKRR